jgi:hypothetical protein
MSRASYLFTQAALAGLFLGEPLLANSMTSTVVQRFPDGSTVEGSSSVLARTNNTVTGTFLTTATPGDAYTVWWVVFNKPENCSGGVCGDDDVLPPPGNVGAGVSVLYATGRVADVHGKAEFGAALKVGDTTHVLFGPGLTDADNAEIHMVLRTHGQALPDAALLQEQISSFDGGCPPNACVDEQFAIHRASDDRNSKALEQMRQRLEDIAGRLGLAP